MEAIEIVSAQLLEDEFELKALFVAEGFEKIRLLNTVKEIINTNDETRKRFEISARTVFRK